MSVSLTLDSAEVTPGTAVRGTVSWSGGDTEAVAISVLWFTRGKGTEDITVVRRVRVETGAATGSEPFELDVPDAPWSFSGRLISVVWTVEASLEPHGEVARADFVLAPAGQEIRV